MNEVEIPLHPMMVHLPIGLSILMPFIFGIIIFFVRKKKVNSNTFIAAVIFQSVLTVAAFAAVQSGRIEEHRMKETGWVSHDLVEAHEHAGKRVFIVMIVTLVVSAAAIATTKFQFPLQIGAFVLSIVVAGMITIAGHLGGELVYIHGAAGPGQSVIQGDDSPPLPLATEPE